MLPNDWTCYRLKELGEIVTGTTPSTTEKSFWDGDIPFITPSDLNESKYLQYFEFYLKKN